MALLHKKDINEDRVSLSEGSREMSLAKKLPDGDKKGGFFYI